MIGFEMTGYSNFGFAWHSSAWTEGSLLFAEVALSARKLPLPAWSSYFVNWAVSKPAKKEVGAIKNLFSQFKAILLYDAANLGIEAYLVVWGGPKTFLTHLFHAGDAADQAAIEFLWKIERAELGEQVVIHLCRCLQDFRLDVVSKNPSDPQLYVKLEL